MCDGVSSCRVCVRQEMALKTILAIAILAVGLPAAYCERGKFNILFEFVTQKYFKVALLLVF